MNSVTTLADKLPEEMNRCRELSQVYANLGRSGAFGKAAIDRELAVAEKAAASGDVVAMVLACQKLKEFK